LIRDNPGRPVPEETFTHSHPSGSSCFLYHLSPFATVHSILFVTTKIHSSNNNKPSTVAGNITLLAFGTDCCAAVDKDIKSSCTRCRCAAQSPIDTACRWGSQQQTCRMLLQRSIDGRDRQTDGHKTVS